MGSPAPIAIIGMAGRFPAAANLTEFWDNLRHGRDCLTVLSDAELIANGAKPQHLTDPKYVRRRPVLAESDAFDAAAFGMTRREAELEDPQYRLFLETSHATLEHAGYDPAVYEGNIGVYAGTNMNRYRDYLESRPEVIKAVGYIAVDISNAPDYMSTFVSYKLGLRGPSMTVLTACSTSLVAVHSACNALRAGDCEMALAGGVDIEHPYNLGYRPMPGGILAPDGIPRAFDAHASGTNFGDGAGAVLLKPLDAALADGDTVYAVIRGSAVNNDGNRKVGFTAPSVDGQSECVQRALRTSGVDPRAISYLEAHGTATPVGDPIELTGLIEAYTAVGGADLPRQYCRIGSVKSNIGHLGQAAGIAGLIKTVLALRNELIPPSINVTELNPAVDWANSPFLVATEPHPWPAVPGQPRRAAVSASGIGGTNSHVIVEEAPEVTAEPVATAAEAVLWSAVNDATTEQLRARLADAFTVLPVAEFRHAAHTLQVGRVARPVRAAVVAADAADAAAALRDPSRVLRADGHHRAITFAFPGQGAQRPGMFADMYAAEPLFRAGCDAAFEVLAPLLGKDLHAVWREGDAAELAETAIAQPLLYVLEYTLAHCLIRWGVQPAALIGHSVGELVAGAVAGVFDFESGLQAVAARAQLMAEAPRGRMLAVGAAVEELSDLITGEVVLAGVNSPRQVVLAGPTDALDSVVARLAERNVPTKALRTSHAFHSPSMAEAAAKFEALLGTLPLHQPKMTVISAATGAVLTAEQARSARFWAEQLVQPVRFDAAASTLFGTGTTTVVEVGPGRGLGAVLRDQPELTATGSRLMAVTAKARTALLELLTQLWVDGESVSYWHERERGNRRRIALPGYPYQRQRHWIEARQETEPTPVVTQAPVAAARPMPAADTWSLGHLEWVKDREGRQPGGQALLSQATALLWHEVDPGVRAALGRAGHRIVTEAAGAEPDLIVHAGLLLVPPTVTADTLDEQIELAVHSLYECARAAVTLHRKQRRPLTLVVLGRHLVDVTGGEPVNPAAAAATALLRSIAQENPGLGTVCLDVAANTPEEALGRELASPTDPLVALRGTARWLPTLRSLPRPDTATQQRLRYRGTYLITGGLGGIGLTVARALAETGLRPKLALLGRSGLPDDERVRTQLEAITAAGAEVAPFTGDVTDLASLHKAVDEVERRFGGINGVVHSAGVPGGGLAERREPAEVDRVLAPKTVGTLNLDTVFADRAELDFLVLFSSQAGLAGLYGSADYAAGNAFVDAYARTVADRERWTVSVQWPGWAEVGMAAKSDVSLSVLTGAVDNAIDVQKPALVRHYAPGESWELDEHVFGGHRVLPGTAILQLAVLAAREAGVTSADAPIELRDTVFLAPVRGDEPINVRVLITPLADVHRFRVQSRPGDASRGWTEHANGTVAATQRATGTRPDLPAESCAEPTEPGAAWVEFGPRWRSLTAHSGGTEQAVARLVLPIEFHADLAAHPLHPALVDSASGVLADLEPGRSYSPFLYQRISVYAPLTTDLIVHARFTSAQRTPRQVDFDLYDTGTGALLARFQGFTLREVQAESFSAVAAPAPTTTTPDRPGLLRPADGAEVFLTLLAGTVPPVISVDAPGARLAVAGMTWDDQPPPQPRPARPPVVRPEPATAPPPPAPESANEDVTTRLRTMWANLLGVSEVGLDDDFFDVGGNSLSAVQLASLIREEFGGEFGAGAIFDLTTIRLMAAELSRP